MWGFKTLGDQEPNAFEISFDGPVQEVPEVCAVLWLRAQNEFPEARPETSMAAILLEQALTVVRSRTENVKNGLRRFAMNLSGGVNRHHGWSLRLQMNLADDPEA
jgi:hypothetical protein